MSEEFVREVDEDIKEERGSNYGKKYFLMLLVFLLVLLFLLLDMFFGITTQRV